MEKKKNVNNLWFRKRIIIVKVVCIIFLSYFVINK